MRRLTLFLVAAFMLAVPMAGAQTLTVAITQSPAEFPSLASNSTATAAIEVSVRLSGVACPAATSIPVTIAVTAGAPVAFFTASTDAESYSISVPAGAYPGDPSGAGIPGPVFSGKTTAGIVGVTTVITDNASIPVQVTATATAPADCQPPGGTPVMSDTITIFSNLTAPPPPPAPTPEPDETPGLGALGVVVALVGAVFIRRTRRTG